MAVLGYDPATKMYTYNAYDSWGEVTTAKGSVSGDTWTWTTEATMQGTLIKTRLTEKEVSKTQYTLKYESSTDGGTTWTSDLESTFTKVVALGAELELDEGDFELEAGLPSRSPTGRRLVDAEGIEPSTCRLRAECSAS